MNFDFLKLNVLRFFLKNWSHFFLWFFKQPLLSLQNCPSVGTAQMLALAMESFYAHVQGTIVLHSDWYKKMSCVSHTLKGKLHHRYVSNCAIVRNIFIKSTSLPSTIYSADIITASTKEHFSCNIFQSSCDEFHPANPKHVPLDMGSYYHISN